MTLVQSSRPTFGERLLQQRLRIVECGQADQADRQQGQQLHAQLRLVGVAGAELVARLPDQPFHGGLGVAGAIRVGLAQHIGHEGGDGFCAPRFGARHLRLPESRAGTAEHRQHRRRRHAGRPRVAPHEAAQQVAGIGRPGQHRQAVQMAFDVVGQRLRGGIARRRLGLERLQHDRVEVAAQRRPMRRFARARRRAAAAGAAVAAVR